MPAWGWSQQWRLPVPPLTVPFLLGEQGLGEQTPLWYTVSLGIKDCNLRCFIDYTTRTANSEGYIQYFLSKKKRCPGQKSSFWCVYHMSTNTHHTRPQGQTMGRPGDLSVTRLYETSKTSYTPLVPILWLLLSTAAEAGRTGSVVKAWCTRAKSMRAFLVSPRYPRAPHRPDSPEPTSALGHSTWCNLMPGLAWHSYLSISEKDIWWL